MLSNMVELLEVRLGENESELIFNTKTTSWLKEDNKKINIEEEFNMIVVKESNKQLNQYSTIYFKKIEKQSFINEK